MSNNNDNESTNAGNGGSQGGAIPPTVLRGSRSASLGSQRLGIDEVNQQTGDPAISSVLHSFVLRSR